MSEAEDTLRIALQDHKFIQQIGESVEDIKTGDVIPVGDNFFE